MLTERSQTQMQKKKRKRSVSKCGQMLIISKHKWEIYWYSSYYILQLFCWICSNYYRLATIFLKGRVGGNFESSQRLVTQKAFRLSSWPLCLHPGWGWANSCLSLSFRGMNYVSEQHRPPLAVLRSASKPRAKYCGPTFLSVKGKTFFWTSRGPAARGLCAQLPSWPAWSEAEFSLSPPVGNTKSPASMISEKEFSVKLNLTCSFLVGSI